MTEYMLVFAAAVAVMVVALNPKGFVTKAVSKSINMMFDSVEDMSHEQCLGTINRVDGGWSGWGSWGACAGCVQTRSRSCTNPSPKCGGSACALTDGSKGLLETQSQACSSGTWTVGSCGVCTGSCGSTVGTCTRLVTCPSGCCPGTKPSETLSCDKPAYPDVWSGLGFGSCSTTCDEGIASQVVTCSGMCCDAMLKPPTRQACTDGCCARTMDIGLDIENGVQFTASFGPAANGQPFSVPCPSGYAGNPTSTCTATANLSCTGNDSYVPPASCYNISWGPVSNTCVPADCPAWTTDIGMGVSGTFPSTLHGSTTYADCATFNSRYQGTSTADCWLGTWQNLTQGCRPADCTTSWTTDIGMGVRGTFPPTTHGTTEMLNCGTFDSRYQGISSATCDYGSWMNLVQGCQPASCVDEIFTDPNGFVQGTFTAGPHGTLRTLDCGTIDNRYTGTFSRTCDYGSWINPAGGCTAASCPSWTTTIVADDGIGVAVTFTGAGHGATMTGTETDATHTCNVQAECCYGIWVDPAAGCSSVPTTNSYSTACSCWLDQCANDPGLSSTIATKCSAGWDTADEMGLTATTSWSVVNLGGCTAQKCEYECNAGFTKSGNNCVGAVCTGSGFANATMCSSDSTGLTADTPRTLVPSCTAGTKCEYVCNGAHILYNGWCCNTNCPVGSCGMQTVCGQPRDCGPCCGNGVINSGEQCDPAGTTTPSLQNLNGKNCTTYTSGSSYTGGTLSCNSDCTFNTSSCCTAVPGTWGDWTDYGTCGQYVACIRREHAITCSATCGGSCPAGGDYRDTKSCGAVNGVWSAWSCSNGTDTRTCNNPSPSCGGAECTLLNGTLTTPGNRTETRVCACPAGQVPTGSCPAGQYDTGGCSAGYYCASPPCP